jgi:hypothetical protein
MSAPAGWELEYDKAVEKWCYVHIITKAKQYEYPKAGDELNKNQQPTLVQTMTSLRIEEGGPMIANPSILSQPQQPLQQIPWTTTPPASPVSAFQSFPSVPFQQGTWQSVAPLPPNYMDGAMKQSIPQQIHQKSLPSPAQQVNQPPQAGFLPQQQSNDAAQMVPSMYQQIFPQMSAVAPGSTLQPNQLNMSFLQQVQQQQLMQYLQSAGLYQGQVLPVTAMPQMQNQPGGYYMVPPQVAPEHVNSTPPTSPQAAVVKPSPIALPTQQGASPIVQNPQVEESSSKLSAPANSAVTKTDTPSVVSPQSPIAPNSPSQAPGTPTSPTQISTAPTSPSQASPTPTSSAQTPISPMSPSTKPQTPQSPAKEQDKKETKTRKFFATGRKMFGDFRKVLLSPSSEHEGTAASDTTSSSQQQDYFTNGAASTQQLGILSNSNPDLTQQQQENSPVDVVSTQADDDSTDSDDPGDDDGDNGMDC